MKKYLTLWQLAGFTASVALGTILHFLFDWTGAFSLAGISAVNESTWEHMKILFFPMLIFACVQYWFFRKEFPGFWWIKLIGTLVGVVSIPVLFYTFNGAFGSSPDWLNILFFFIAITAAYLLEFWLLKRDYFLLPLPILACIALFIIAFCFGLFTFYPPKLPIFQDPITNLYGIVDF